MEMWINERMQDEKRIFSAEFVSWKREKLCVKLKLLAAYQILNITLLDENV